MKADKRARKRFSTTCANTKHLCIPYFSVTEYVPQQTTRSFIRPTMAYNCVLAAYNMEHGRCHSYVWRGEGWCAAWTVEQGVCCFVGMVCARNLLQAHHHCPMIIPYVAVSECDVWVCMCMRTTAVRASSVTRTDTGFSSLLYIYICMCSVPYIGTHNYVHIYKVYQYIVRMHTFIQEAGKYFFFEFTRFFSLEFTQSARVLCMYVCGVEYDKAIATHTHKNDRYMHTLNWRIRMRKPFFFG